MTAGQRGKLAALRAVTWLACHLPERPLHRCFAAIGAALYLVDGTRRDLARRNLTRICAWLVAEGRATPRVARAARDRRAMDRLVRSAFSHHARYYLEVLRISTLTGAYLEARLDFGDWEPIRAGFRAVTEKRGLMYIGMHYASMEVPARYAILQTGAIALTPMETVDDPAIQAWAEEQRQPIGLEIIDPARGGRRMLAYAREGGLLTVVGDRPLAGTARPVELFGAPAMLPVGPALVAVETGITCQIAVSRRTGLGTYEIDLHELAVPAPGGPLRERMATFMAAEARAMEGIVAVAPEQWWTCMYPIWDDIR
ncbi:MAG: lysophospholipid acyltransferase family protein [Candidatus Limnocylindrales bacterium]